MRQWYFFPTASLINSHVRLNHNSIWLEIYQQTHKSSLNATCNQQLRTDTFQTFKVCPPISTEPLNRTNVLQTEKTDSVYSNSMEVRDVWYLSLLHTFQTNSKHAPKDLKSMVCKSPQREMFWSSSRCRLDFLCGELRQNCWTRTPSVASFSSLPLTLVTPSITCPHAKHWSSPAELSESPPLTRFHASHSYKKKKKKKKKEKKST